MGRSVCVAWLMTAVCGVAAAQGQPARLEYKWAIGDEARYRIVQTNSTTMTGIPQQPETIINHTLTQVVRQTVESASEDGGVRLRQTFESVHLQLEVPASNRSETGGTGREAAAMASTMANTAMSAMVGESILISVSPTGLVTKVEGMSRLLEKMVAKLPASEGQQQSMDQLKAMMGDEPMRKMIERSFAVFPDTPVSPGESWTRETEVPLPFLGTMTATTTSTFKGMEVVDGSQMARLAMVVVMKPRAGTPAPPSGPFSGSVSDTKTEADVLFDATLGRLYKATTTMATTMTMRVAVADGEPMTMQTAMRGTLTMELVQ
jgi:hypothetical protein